MKRQHGMHIAIALAACLVAGSAVCAQQPPGGVAASDPTFRMVRSVSGSKGTQQGGRFVVEDPRTVFHVPEDKQIVVYFEWEGPVGSHHFEGLWKNPEGKIVSISDFRYDAKERRFGGYWSLLISEAMSSGVWLLEARINGEAAGTHAFQIMVAPRPPDAPPARRILTPGEIYQQGLAASVFIEALDERGERIRVSSGFFLGERYVVTAFQVIDGAARLRIRAAGGQTTESDRIAGWNRLQDWAVVEVEEKGSAHLARAKEDSWNVGDRCYTLDVPAEGNRVIADTDIIGTHNDPVGGQRLNVSFPIGRAAVGAPLLNEFAEVIGVMGGSLLPGANATEATRVSFSMGLGRGSYVFRGGLAVPITLVRTGTGPVTLEQIRASGQMIAPLTHHRHIMYGQFARQIRRGSPAPQLVDETFEFRSGEAEVAFLVAWNPKARIRSNVIIEVFDVYNRKVSTTQPRRMRLNASQVAYTTGAIPIAHLPPGVYRVDVLLDEGPAWRMFFRVQ